MVNTDQVEPPTGLGDACRALKVRPRGLEVRHERTGDATGLLDTAQLVRERGRANEAAFHLHQAAEKAYHGLILALTLYSAKTHRLNVLGDRAEALSAHLIDIWPRTTKFERQGFDLIRRPYVEARYSAQYQISGEHLTWLEHRVELLLAAVKSIALERIEVLARSR